MTPDAKLRMDVYQEGQRAAKNDLQCPYTDWRAGTWKKGFDAARAHYEAQVSQESLRPCRSPYCECDPGKCTHPGCYDARHEPWPPT